jgi:hypothetical protein
MEGKGREIMAKDKDGWENAAPRKTGKWDCAWFLVKWGNDSEEELVIWPTGEGGCSWRYGVDGDDPEHLNREKIKEEKIYFKGPVRAYTEDKELF